VGNVKDWARGIDGLKNRSGKCEGPGGRGGGGLGGEEQGWVIQKTGPAGE